MNKQQLDLHGSSFAYRASGHGDPMVLVHANISDMRSWTSIEPLLAHHFRVITYSRRFAYPNRPPEAEAHDALTQHAEDLIALIEKLHLGKVHLVGNSSGAFICLLAAQRRPDLVRTLSLEEPPVVSMFLQALPPKPGELGKLLFSSPGTLLELIKFGARVIGPATQAFRQGNDTAALDIFARGVLGAGAFAKVTPARKQQMTDNISAHRATMLGAGLPVFTATEAAAIETPTLLIRGANTPDFQRRINQRLAELVPGANEICIPDASHLVHEDNPQAVAEAVCSFCRSTDGRARSAQRRAS